MRTFTSKILAIVGRELADLDIRDKNTWGDGIVLLADRVTDICEAALKLRDIFRGTNWGRFELPRLDIRISVHHGEYLRGVDYFTDRAAVCGRTIVTAARIEPVTPPGRIWITEDAALALRRHIEAEKRAERPDYFAVDDIGAITLPKNYGIINISCLRRYDELPLSNSELSKIHEAEALRLAGADGDLSKLAKSTNSQSYAVLVGVLVKDGRLLLVKRADKSEGLEWMFPSSGKTWPTGDLASSIEREILDETGVSCRYLSAITEVAHHPVTGFRCIYVELVPEGDGEASNLDPAENLEVAWVPIAEGIRKLGRHLNPEVGAYLRGKLAL